MDQDALLGTIINPAMCPFAQLNSSAVPLCAPLGFDLIL